MKLDVFKDLTKISRQVKTVERQTKHTTRLMSDEEKTRRRREKLVKVLSNLLETESRFVFRRKQQHKISIRTHRFLRHRVNSSNFFIFDRRFEF